MSATGNPLEVVHNLEGMTLPTGWKILTKKEKKSTDTGGNFSVCYHVTSTEGKAAFMKVLNLARVLAQPGDQLTNIQHLIETFNFERKALDVCEQYRLRRVAAALEHGKLDLPGNPYGVFPEPEFRRVHALRRRRHRPECLGRGRCAPKSTRAKHRGHRTKPPLLVRSVGGHSLRISNAAQSASENPVAIILPRAQPSAP